MWLTKHSDSTRYPVELADGTANVYERPQWRDYWAAIYQYYTVLGCEYEIIMYNPLQVKNIRLMSVAARTGGLTAPATLVPIDNGWYNTDCVVATQFDTYSSTEGATGNVMPLTYYEEIRAFKNIKWTPVPGGQKAIIKGVYKPGDAKRNIANDGDVKTWSKTSVGVPTSLSEILTLNFFTDPFFDARLPDAYATTTTTEPSATGTGMTGVINMEIKLKYIVQYKDLKLQARYPNTITGAGSNLTQILS